MSKNPNDKKDLSDSSLLSAAITIAPATGGVGYGLYQMMKDRQFRPPRETAFASAARRVGNAGLTGGNRLQDLAWLQGNATQFASPEGAEIARQAWIRAVQAVHPSAEHVMGFTQGIANMPATNVYSAISETVAKNQSIYMKKTLARFKQNVTALERQKKLTGGIPAFQSAQDIALPPTGRSVAEGMLPEGIRLTAGRVKQKLEAGVQYQFYTRPGWEERGLGMYHMKFTYSGGQFTLRVPVANQGLLAEGLTQSSLRFAPDVAVFEKGVQTGRYKTHEFFMKNFEESILPQIEGGRLKTGWDVQSAIDELYEQDIYSLESAVNLPPSVRNAAQESRRIVKGQSVRTVVHEPGAVPGKGDLFKSVFRAPESREQTAILRGHPELIPSTSPSQLAEGIYSEFDPRHWSMTPEAEDYSRRSMQAFREWRASPEASQEIMKTPWAIYQTQAWRQELGAYSHPYLETVWFNPKKQQNLMKQIGLSNEGETGLSNDPLTRKMTKQGRATDVALASAREKEISSGYQFKHGEIIGWTPEGEAFQYKRGMKLLGVTSHETTGKGRYLSLAYEEHRAMTEAEKKFGASKGMERFFDIFRAQRQIAEETHSAIFSENVKRVISMDELRKNASKHNSQMITALHRGMLRKQAEIERIKSLSPREYTEFLLKGGEVPSITPMGRRLLQNPVSFARFHSKKAFEEAGGTSGEKYRERFVERMMGFASKEKQSAEEFGYAFGAVPYALGDETALRLAGKFGFSSRHETNMLRGLVGGMSQNVYAGPKELTGAGSMGSVEPRLFDFLESGHFGELGPQMAADIQRRLVQTNPEKLASHKALTRTIESIAGKDRGAHVGEPFNLAQGYNYKQFQEFIEKGGGHMKIGKYGLPDVFVPGPEQVPAMGLYQTAGESGAVSQNVGRMYHDLARKMATVHADVEPLGLEGARGAFDQFLGQIGKQQAAGGKGAGAFLRGRVAGSRFLTGVSEFRGHRALSPDRALISEGMMNEMYEDMLSSGLYDNQKLEAQMRRLAENKKVQAVIPGGILRHPDTGPYSFMPMNFGVMWGVKDPVMVLPTHDITLKLAGSESRKFSLSPLVSLQGDLDADTFAAMLFDPDVAHNIKTQYNASDSVARRAYIEHNLRSQLIEAKAAKSTAGMVEISAREKAIADAKKLATAEQFVPELSVKLSKARAAVSRHLSGQEQADAMWLLQWTEQVPIAGKHLQASDVLDESMSTFFKSVGSAFDTNNPERFHQSLTGIMSNLDETGKALLKENVTVEEGMRGLRAMTNLPDLPNSFRSVNLEATSRNIMRAQKQAAENLSEEAMKFATGRKGITMGNVGRFLQSEGTRVVEEEGGRFADLAAASSAARNIAASVGAGILEHKGAVGLGFAGSIALAMALSTPEETIGSGTHTLTRSKMNSSPGKAVSRMSPDTMMPAGQQLGSPTVPNMMYQPRAMIAPGAESARISVRARSMGRSNTDWAGRLQGAAGGNTSVNVNIRDNTSTMNPHTLANKLFN